MYWSEVRAKTIGKIFGVLLWIAIGAFIYYDEVVRKPVGAAEQTALEIEFTAVTPVPTAKIVSYNASHKSTQAQVGTTYSSNAPFEDIKAFYDPQLKAHGWHFKDETPVHDWFRDVGGRLVVYCKGPYAATLQYAGRDAGYGWNYSFNLSWGLRSYCKS